ncbi:MAG TPA: alginate export family protein, partial [Verrucomicrobiae bacterium]|nr:alginate export family protein [Verrucomicrobiae bacterium]
MIAATPGRWRFRAGVASALLLCGTATGQSGDSKSPSHPPPFKQLRYDEDYSYLLDPSRRAEFLDALKFIPLNAWGDSYLTLGGEIRERYEYYHESLWGRGAQDTDGYLLERYMVHADAHFSENFRVFTQFKSG